MSVVNTKTVLSGAVRVISQPALRNNQPDTWRVELGERDKYGTAPAWVNLTRQEAELLISLLTEALA